MRVLSASDLHQGFCYPDLIEALRMGFQTDVVAPPRHHHSMAHFGATLLLMPAWKADQFTGVKVVGVYPENMDKGLPSVQGSYLLMDGTTGQSLAVLDGPSLTALRTAACAALAADSLARVNSNSLLMLGTGSLAPELIRAHAAVRPLEQIFIWGRNPTKADALALQLSKEFPGVQAIQKPDEVISKVDIICTATLSEKPLVLGSMLQPGQHLALIGAFKSTMRESDVEVLLRSTIFADNPEGCVRESGDFAIPIQEGLFAADGIQASLPELCAGTHAGRQSPDEITVYKSVGHAAQDLIAATYFYLKSCT
jgi:ornithine cyclodeaminase